MTIRGMSRKNGTGESGRGGGERGGCPILYSGVFDSMGDDAAFIINKIRLSPIFTSFARTAAVAGRQFTAESLDKWGVWVMLDGNDPAGCTNDIEPPLKQGPPKAERGQTSFLRRRY